MVRFAHQTGTALHGLLFVAFRKFLEDRFGLGVTDSVFKVETPEQRIHAREVYPDSLFNEHIEATRRLVRRSADQLLHEFGAHAIGTFYELYPSYFPAQGARRFLAQLEESIHRQVRDVLPGATPPDLTVEDLGAGRLRIEYRSKRNLCPLLAGLLDGTGIHYQTPVRYTEDTCMRRGDPACVFMVEVQQTLLPRGVTKTVK